MEMIKAVEVRKQYQNHLALDNVSFSINKGSIFGLLGPNGAGKTTFIRILNQITAPDSGYILFNGEKLKPEDVGRIGYLPEERGLYKKMKVGEQALYLARLKGLDKPTAMRELKKWFERFEIISWWDKKVEELSKGMAQKIQFITTVIHHPSLLIFDEPFSGFDPVNVNILKEEILKLRDEGATVVFSTHNMASVEELCDDIVLINKSRIVLEGNVNAIKKQFGTNTYSFELNLFPEASLEGLMSEIKVNDHILNADNLVGTINPDDKELHSNQIISILMKYGNLYSFKEILPTMNDIFINIVTEK
ncbi:ATP-binding cassette domain-containing protein [Bacteroidales bacterium OttesenSCG-928-K03]|nr:ATP-binding cassette domain-containing protein [Bacteroidales bacterium OttesenSCG-928-L14]MDL2240753.1 ATP-binding cassette domain-containing protein [Bacteroidales bacterium OttesenSCG-928-K22]MDL2242238.1 ATP-binding cassette domain-containing protein [Bacteroidales bacterium OttesenSCG-928-K03]